MAPTAIAKPPMVAKSPNQEGAEAAETPAKQCDLSTTCPNCSAQMQPEHAHYRCGECGYRDSCCF
jgi:Zn finger protein HypA/HybF involved in hydrogenase expression